ncbi:alpha-galactosidase [Enterococcus sp. JM4C]|uniref:alpha-galactosidase n=1 Tax=Candidatus Enterococcus huntleyi TaxID=1857217 RepID=UPI00137B39D0|nr:alpha-galactosidase [Enterococcus sp. JM4C]KAF1298137.1 alpha-galactosidase [Enterococcus sp. JM4C]
MISIQFDEQTQTFHLSNQQVSYLFSIEEGQVLSHLYYGKKITHYHGNFRYPRLDRSFSPNLPGAIDRSYSLDTVLQEYPGFGGGDFRTPAHEIRQSDGTIVTNFTFKEYRVIEGKPSLTGLPATYVNATTDAQTLLVTLEDRFRGLELELSYTIFDDSPVIARNTRLVNKGKEKVVIEKLASLAIDFPATAFDLIHLNGTWAKERMVTREPLNTGIKVLDSKRGSSSHQQNPFVALASPTTTEETGEVYGFCLVYSGNHETMIEKDPYDQTRVTMGINSFDFRWVLEPEDSFQSPEVILNYSDQGLNELSHSYHELFNHRLVRGQHQQKERPVLINNWEATYFDFDEDKLLAIVDEAQKIGIELFVLDDGWFGKRESDNSSLGDWFENAGKIKMGLANLSKEVHARGLEFGIWFEPEMISEDSDLYRAHPDWALQIPGRGKSLGRSQYVLDFSRADVRGHIYQQMKAFFDEVPVDYVKWDMNRNMTEVYSKNRSAEEQGSTAHRYMLGLYEFMEQLTSEYPAILFESCSGGGGRFDAGMLHYMPQTWTSDNTDAVARLKIQYGTSLVYPISTMGSHVSAIPNHQTSRKTSLAMRGNVAMSGVFGYELDLSTLSEEDKAEMKEQVAFYKAHRSLLQYGTFTRLLSPFEGNETAWIFVSDDKKEAMVFYYRVLVEASRPLESLKLRGLDAEKVYQMNEQLFGGDELMNLGFYIDPTLSGDYASQMFYLKEVAE